MRLGRVEIGLAPRRCPRLELRDEPVQVPVHDPLRIADPLGHLAELAAEREALGDRVGGDDGGGAAVERVGERGGVPRPPGELDRLAAQRVAALARVLVAERSREAGEQPDPKLDVLLAERGEPLLEQRHEPIVVARPAPR